MKYPISSKVPPALLTALLGGCFNPEGDPLADDFSASAGSTGNEGSTGATMPAQRIGDGEVVIVPLATMP